MKAIHELIRDTGALVELSGREYKTLVENAKNYEGNEYKRKVVSEMVTLSETELNVPFNQLLAKWDLFMVELLEGSFEGAKKSFSDEVLEKVQDYAGSSLLLSMGWFDDALEGLPGYRPSLANWREVDVDFNESNALGTINTWGEGVYKEIVDSEEVILFVHLDESSPASASPKVTAAAATSEFGKFTTGAQSALFRALNFADAFADNREVKLVIHGTSSFWGAEVNKALVGELISWMGIDTASFYAHASEFNESAFFGSTELLLILGTEGVKKTAGNIILPGLRGEPEQVFYSNEGRELDYLSDEFVDLSDDLSVVGYREIDADGNIGPDTVKVSTGGREFGFLTINGVETIENLPRTGSKNIPIVAENLKDMVAYFGLAQSLSRPEDNGLGLPRILTGKPGYAKVVANCLPLFLYGPLSNRRDRGVLNVGGERIRLRNNMIVEAPEIAKLVEDSVPYMDFEAASMFQEMKNTEDTSGKTIHDYLDETPDFRPKYDEMVDRLKTHLNSNYDHYVL